MTTQQIIQALYRAFRMVRKLPQFKQPYNASSRQHVVLVSWYSMVRKGNIHQWYHPDCYQSYKKDHIPRYQECMQEVDINSLRRDVLCVGCRHWISTPKSMRTVEMPKVELEK